MRKRLAAGLFALVLLVSAMPLASAQSEGLDRFKPVYTYTTGRFEDIQSVKWYAQYVQVAYELGLISGRSDTRYEPLSNVTLAEAAARGRHSRDVTQRHPARRSPAHGTADKPGTRWPRLIGLI